MSKVSVVSMVLVLVLLFLGCASGPEYSVDPEQLSSLKTIGVLSVHSRIFDGANAATLEAQKAGARRARLRLEDGLEALASWSFVPGEVVVESDLVADFEDMGRSDIVSQVFGGDPDSIDEAQEFNQMFAERFITEEGYPIVDYPQTTLSVDKARVALINETFGALDLDAIVLLQIESAIGKGDATLTVGDRTVGDINLHGYLYILTEGSQLLLRVDSEKSIALAPVFTSKEQDLVDFGHGDLVQQYHQLLDEMVDELVVKVSEILAP